MKILRYLAFLGALTFVAPLVFAQSPRGAMIFGRIPGGVASWGLAWSDRGYDEAQGIAREECLRRGAVACLIVGFSPEPCGALAVVDGTNRHGTGWGGSIELAERNALSACGGQTRACRVVVTRCAR